MEFDTMYTLHYGCEGHSVECGNDIKVFLKNGEILIGTYNSSDNVSLEIERQWDCEDIDFSEIESIEEI